MKKIKIPRIVWLILALLFLRIWEYYQDPTPAANTINWSVAESDESIEYNGIKIPWVTDTPYTVIHNNVPWFFEEDMIKEPFEYYSKLDYLGRCGPAYANICIDLMPTDQRESISNVRPSGWNNKNYGTLVDGEYIYNRCHLIGFQLAGENANPLNLITGTRYMNVQGMLPFENMVADYVKEDEGHVLYRVTPVFVGEELVARGVIIEAKSVESDDIEFCVFVYNVQPGIEINYSNGESWKSK